MLIEKLRQPTDGDGIRWVPSIHFRRPRIGILDECAMGQEHHSQEISWLDQVWIKQGGVDQLRRGGLELAGIVIGAAELVSCAGGFGRGVGSLLG